MPLPTAEVLQKGVLVGQVQLLQELLHDPKSPSVALIKIDVGALSQLLDQLVQRMIAARRIPGED